MFAQELHTFLSLEASSRHVLIRQKFTTHVYISTALDPPLICLIFF